MPGLTGKQSFVLLLAILISLACKKEYSCENCLPVSNPDPTIPVNQAPHANAGADQIIILPVNGINLDGSLSTDPDGTIVRYSWITISAQSTVTFSNANAAQTTAGNLVEGDYHFELEVIDDDGLKSKDTMAVVVKPGAVASRWTQLDPASQIEFHAHNTPIVDENILVGIRDEVYAVSIKGNLWHFPWTKIGPLPGFARDIHITVAFSIDDIGYFIGAGDSWQFDLATREITKKTNTPVGDDRVDQSIPLVIRKKAYLVSSINNHVTVYDPLTDTYTRRNNFPGNKAVTGFLIGDDGYCVEEDGKCWKYDYVTDRWQQKAALPKSIYTMSGFSLKGYGYILGDLNYLAHQGTDHIKLWQYYPDSDIWAQLSDDFPGRGVSWIKTISLNEIVYVGFGFSSGDDHAVDLWRFN